MTMRMFNTGPKKIIAVCALAVLIAGIIHIIHLNRV